MLAVIKSISFLIVNVSLMFIIISFNSIVSVQASQLAHLELLEGCGGLPGFRVLTREEGVEIYEAQCNARFPLDLTNFPGFGRISPITCTLVNNSLRFSCLAERISVFTGETEIADTFLGRNFVQAFCPLHFGEGATAFDTIADGECACLDSNYEPRETTTETGCLRKFEESDDDPDKDDDPCVNDNIAGNPCHVATGVKFHTEIDFSTGIQFMRNYNSRNLASLGLGKGWRHNHQRKLIITADSMIQVSAFGRGESWERVGEIWQGDSDSDVIIQESATGFHLTKSSGEIEYYDSNGTLLKLTDTNGFETVYNYNSDGQLEKITNQYGHFIELFYTNNFITEVLDSFGSIFRYEYDDTGNLVSVVFPDTTPDNDTDNPQKTYHYENLNFPNHLTGITDQNSDRISTYSYDTEGKAITSQRGQTTNPVGQQRIELDFEGGNQ